RDEPGDKLGGSGGAIEEAAVELEVAVDDAVEGEVGLDAGAGGLAEVAGEVGVAEDAEEGGGPGGGVVGGDEEAGAAVVEEVRVAADGRGEAGQAGGHGLE